MNELTAISIITITISTVLVIAGETEIAQWIVLCAIMATNLVSTLKEVK